MKKIHSRTAAVALASVSALAISSAAQAQNVNWTGFYVGANAGAAWGHSDAVTDVPCPSTAPPAYFCRTTNLASLANGAAVASAGTGPMSGSGFTGGGQLGYNWQMGNIVYGVETDFGAFNISASRQASAHFPASFNVQPTNIFTVGSAIDTDWLFTARGRVGWTFSNVLVYGTGGLALTKLELSHFYMDDYSNGGVTGANASGSASATKVGWTLGGGVEWAMNRNWSVKAEYLYVDFGSVTVNSTIRHLGNLGYAQAISTSADLTAHIARAGINYKF